MTVPLASDTIFCPSAKTLGSGAIYGKRMNSNGDPSHWNYVGPDGDGGRRLLDEDSGFNWVNMRSNYGIRALALEAGKSGPTASVKLSQVRGQKAFLSDWWCAVDWYQSTVESLAHEETINTWYTDGSASGFKLDTKKFFDDDKVKLRTTWKIIYEGGQY